MRGPTLEALESEVDRLAAIDPTELDDAGVNALVAELAAAIDCLEAWRDTALAIWWSRVGTPNRGSPVP